MHSLSTIGSNYRYIPSVSGEYPTHVEIFSIFPQFIRLGSSRKFSHVLYDARPDCVSISVLRLMSPSRDMLHRCLQTLKTMDLAQSSIDLSGTQRLAESLRTNQVRDPSTAYSDPLTRTDSPDAESCHEQYRH